MVNANPGVAIHFISDPDLAKVDLPRFLRHELPSKDSAEGIDNGDYSRPPEAFLLGLGYTNEVVKEFRSACESTGCEGVPWLVGGRSKKEFRRLLNAKSLGPPEKQAPITAGQQKRKLLDILRNGHGGKDGVYTWYGDCGGAQVFCQPQSPASRVGNSTSAVKLIQRFGCGYMSPLLVSKLQVHGDNVRARRS